MGTAYMGQRASAFRAHISCSRIWIGDQELIGAAPKPEEEPHWYQTLGILTHERLELNPDPEDGMGCNAVREHLES